METLPPALSPVSAWSRLVAMVIAGLLLSGALLRIGALSPTNVLGADIHERLFTAHGVLVLPTTFLALVYFAPRRAETDSLRVPLGDARDGRDRIALDAARGVWHRSGLRSRVRRAWLETDEDQTLEWSVDGRLVFDDHTESASGARSRKATSRPCWQIPGNRETV